MLYNVLKVMFTECSYNYICSHNVMRKCSEINIRDIFVLDKYAKKIFLTFNNVLITARKSFNFNVLRINNNVIFW